MTGRSNASIGRWDPRFTVSPSVRAVGSHQAFETPADPIVKSQMYTPEAGDRGPIRCGVLTESGHYMQMMIPPYIKLVEFKITVV